MSNVITLLTFNNNLQREVVKMKIIKFWLCSLISILLTMPFTCLAFTAPSSGDTGYEIYEFVTTTIMDGAIGITICIALIAFAGFWIARSNVWGALACFVAAVLFYSAEDVALSIGVLF